MNFLFFDCETTGKPKAYNASYEDVENWPRVTQLAWMLCNEAGEILLQHQSLITPDGWEIPEEEFFINNNMSTVRCQEHGQPINLILGMLMEAKQQAQFLVAHNLNFDHRVVWAEFIRAGIEPKRGMSKICTMMKSTKYCNIPGARGPKWPKLEELYMHLFGKNFDGAHDAMADVIALKDSFFELVARGVIVPELPAADSVIQ